MNADQHDNSRVVIIGAGHAGGTVAATLRHYGHRGPIALIGEEPDLPYQRPPLSKACLTDDVNGETLMLRPADFYGANEIDVRCGATATDIDRERKKITFSDGTEISYDCLVIATGARAIALALPGATMPGIMSLRTLADAGRLKTALGAANRIVIVGGGYIGLEVAAAARVLGSEVTVLERESRVLARVASPQLSDFYTRFHQSRGVKFELGAEVISFQGAGGRVSTVVLADGRTLDCDSVIVGVGAHPNDELAVKAGLETRRGIVVDRQSRTSDPAIFAIGDVAHRPLPLFGRTGRIESVPNALEQSRQVAAAIVGRADPAGEVPWFWSDQFDLKLQIAGMAFDIDRTIVRGDPAAARFAVFHLSGDRLHAVEAVNSPAEFVAGKQYILTGKPLSPDKLVDPSISMKEVAV